MFVFSRPVLDLLDYANGVVCDGPFVLQSVYPIDEDGKALGWDRLITDPVRLEARGTGVDPPGSVTAQLSSGMSSAKGTMELVRFGDVADCPHFFRGQGPLSQFVTATSPGTAAALTNQDVDYGTAQSFITTLGKASRGVASEKGDPTARKPPASLELFKSAGYEDVHVVIVEWTGVTCDFFAASQAEVFLYLGHGWHDDNHMMLMGDLKRTDPNVVGPGDIGTSWTHGLQTAVFFGCTVLDINDYNGFGPGSHYSSSASPGKVWAQLPGPTLYVGFEAEAPLLTGQGGSTILLNLAAAQAANPDWTGNWKTATDPSQSRGGGAAVLDRTNRKYSLWIMHGILWHPLWWEWQTKSFSDPDINLP